MTWLLVLPLATTLLANVPTARPEPTIEPAGAEPSPAFTGAPREPESGWYGAPALALDGAVVLGVAAIVETGNTSSHEAAPLLYGLAAAYLLGGPVMHAVHGDAVHSIESLLLRAGAVVAGVVTLFAVADKVGCETEGTEHGSCDRAAGYLITMPALAAMLVDDLLLARDAPVQPSAGTHVSTRVVVQPGLAMLGIGGTF